MHGLIVLFTVASALLQDSTLITYQLNDHRGDRHSDAEIRNRVALIIHADREGSHFVGQWGRAIRKALGDSVAEAMVRRVNVADVRELPSLMRPFVGRLFGGKAAVPTLMDWDGVFARSYALPPHTCSVLVVDRSGLIVARAGGREPDSAQVDLIVRALRESLALQAER
jgi:hypothetical protein